jgi:hypothetical protein
VCDGDYNRHLSAVQRVIVRKGAGKPTPKWVRKTEGARKDWHDCETYNLALALGPAACDALPTRDQMVEDLRRRQSLEQRRRRPRGHRNHDGREYLANHR